MYFLTASERTLLARKLLPEARQINVHNDLRGWHWSALDAPLRPTYEAPLGVWEIASGYCRTARDVYARHVAGAPAPPTSEMAEGGLLHAAVAALLLEAKRIIFTTPIVDVVQRLAELPSRNPGSLGPRLPAPAGGPGQAGHGTPRDPELDPLTAEKVAILERFESHRLVAIVEEVLSQQPRIGPDALAAHALPVIVEQKIDGRFLGLSAHLSVDAYCIHPPMVLDLKFGPREEFHRLSTTGYALALESQFDSPVNLGCIVYASFRDGTVQIERDFHFIDDELRSRFIEERDQKMRIVQEALDPGLPAECYDHCQFLAFCGTAARPRARVARAS
ncbi:MAG: type I-A CRISPR-associated protein Cas4/Csa1 [Chloroflexota bacterium]